MHKIKSVKRAKAKTYRVVSAPDPAEGIVDGLIPTARDDYDAFDHDYDIFGSPPLYEDNPLVDNDMDKSPIAKEEERKMAILAKGSSSSSSGDEGDKDKYSGDEGDDEDSEVYVRPKSPPTRIGRLYNWMTESPTITKNKCCRCCFISFSRTKRFFNTLWQKGTHQIKNFIVAIFQDPLPANRHHQQIPPEEDVTNTKENANAWERDNNNNTKNPSLKDP